MDEKGNVYISNGLGVTAFDPTGAKVLGIPIKGGATNNVFGGKDNNTLFITGPSDKLTSVKMNVKGVEKF
jgi:gluconolactonase